MSGGSADPSSSALARFAISLNGTELVSASGLNAPGVTGVEGRTGLAVGSGSGSTEINFKDFEVLKPQR